MNFLEAQKVLLKILKLLGFFTYAMKSDVTRNRFHYVHCVIMGALIQGLFVYCHLHYLEKVGNYLGDGNHASDFYSIVEGFCVGFCYLIVYYSVFVCSSSQIEFIEKLLRIEREIGALRFSRSTYNERLRKTSLSDIFWTLIGAVAIFLTLSVVTSNNNYITLMIANWMFLSMTIYLTLLLFFIENLVSTVGSLADELSWNFQNCVTSCPFHFFSEDLKQIFKLHDRLVQSIAVFNKSFGIIVLGTNAFCILIFTFEAYFAYAIFFDASRLTPTLNVTTALNFAGNVVGYVPLIFALSKLGFVSGTTEEKVCSSFFGSNEIMMPSLQVKQLASNFDSLHKWSSCTQQKVRGFRFHKWPASNLPKLISFQQVSRFILHTLCMRANFTANDFFNINNAMCYNVSESNQIPLHHFSWSNLQLITAIVTFLVVLIQFRQFYELKRELWLASGALVIK